MFISNLKIKNYRNFDNLEIEFHVGLNVIVGPNNAGKSNIMKVLSFLKNDPNATASVEDFNKYLLYKDVLAIKNTPPIIEIEYTIEHDLNFEEEDSAFSRLSHILVFDTNGDLKTAEDGHAHLIAKTILKYEFDYREIESYKKEMVNAIDFNAIFSVLKKMQKNYKWTFYNVINNQEIEKKYIMGIFDVDEISAIRTIDKLTDNSRKYVDKKIKDKGIDTYKLNEDITKKIQKGLRTVNKEIIEDIDKDQNKIGITNGKNKFVSNFIFDQELSNFFKYELEDSEYGFPLQLDSNGLGYNNLIYMRNLLKQKKNNEYNILLIEEPEAHLHPNMQYKLLHYIDDLKEQDSDETKIRNQIFVTTHSANITATVDINNLIILSIERQIMPPKSRAICLANNYNFEKLKDFLEFDKDEDLDEFKKILVQGKSHLVKFLDVTRSDMLFSDKIILVEGLSEKLLIPKFFPDLIKEHVSIIELGGINFNYFLPIVFNTNKKILCITDIDKDIVQEIDNILMLEKNKYVIKQKEMNINKYFLNHQQIKVKRQLKYGATFEKELFIENYENNFQLLISIAIPDINSKLKNHKSLLFWFNNIKKYITNGMQKKFLMDKATKYKLLYDQSDDKDLVEKMFFTDVFYHYIEKRKGDFALQLFSCIEKIIIPEYIKEGIKWLKE